jgi:general secretion pathway protein C
LVNSALFTLCCFLVADTANAIISALLSQAPPAAVEAAPTNRGQSRAWSERQSVIDRNLFHSSELVAQAAAPEPEPEEDLEETDLPLKLWGTIASADPEQSWASIEELDQRITTPVRVGDELSRATVVGIERQRVVLLENGKRRSLSLDDSDSTLSLPSISSRRTSQRTPRSKSRQPTARTSRSTDGGASALELARDRIRKLSEERLQAQANEAARALEDPSQLLSQASFVPKMNQDGGIEGIKISAIQAGSPLSEVGIPDGSVITGINGVPIGEFSDFAEIPAALQSALNSKSGTTITVTGPDGAPLDFEVPSQR